MARILLVDDDPSIRDVMRLNLEAQGHHVVEACDGREALRRYRDGGIDLILADVMMPHMDGLRLLAELHPQIRDEVPFILLTTCTDPTAVEAAMYADAFDYLSKPFDAAQVVRVIDRALASRRPRLRPSGEGVPQEPLPQEPLPQEHVPRRTA